MKEESIAALVKTLTQHVRKSAHLTAWDTVRWPTQREIDERRAAIESVCDELDTFGQRTDSEDTRFFDFEMLRQKLTDHSAFPLLDHLSAVALAFQKLDRLDAKPAEF
jgi:hypothetical protein